MTAVAGVMEAVDAAIAAGRPAAALAVLEARLAEDPADPAPYRAGVKALSAAVAADPAIPLAGDPSWTALVRTLVLQQDCPERPRILHHSIASLLTSQNAETARRLTAALLPALGPLPQDGETAAPGLVLLLMIVRAVLPEAGPSQELISRLHLAHFPRFAAGDLSLPYSVKFNPALFGANRDDLLGRYPDAAAVLSPGAGLAMRHLLLLDRLGAGPLFAAPDNGDLRAALHARLGAAAGKPADGAEAEDERAAARPLLLRYWRPGGCLDVATLGALGLQPELLEAAAGLPRLVRDRPGRAPTLDTTGRKALNSGLNLIRMQVPALARAGRRVRVALCVSGQLRGYRAALRTWQRGLLPLADFDIYIHTWQNVGRASPQPFRAFLPFEGEAFCREWRRIGTREGIEALQARQPHLFTALRTSALIDAGTLRDLYGAREAVVEDETGPRFAGFSNQDKMHYKIGAAHDLAMASGQSYDLVMRLRPDLPMVLPAFSWATLRAACAGAAVIYADGGYGVHYEALMTGDQVAVGAPDAMSIYAGTWKTYRPVAALGLAGVPRELTGHVSLAQTCWLSGLDVRMLPVKRGSLLEMESLSAAEIRKALEEDAAGRNDAIDQAFLDANRADLPA